MFLNILSISASSVLKMFLNITLISIWMPDFAYYDWSIPGP